MRFLMFYQAKDTIIYVTIRLIIIKNIHENIWVKNLYEVELSRNWFCDMLVLDDMVVDA